MNCKNLLAQTHLCQSTAAKVLCKLLQKKHPNRFAAHPYTPNSGPTLESLNALIISEAGNPKTFLKRFSLLSERSKWENTVHHPRPEGS